MKALNQMSQGELAAFIDSHLTKNGIDVVLSGGACVAIYSNNKYVSKDLDFVAQFFLDRKKVEVVMQNLGFEPRGRYFYHADTPFFVEFLPGPPSVGQDPIEEIRKIELATGIVRMISPTDSLKDRLAGYYHWGDRQSLEQAILVATSTSVDLKNVEAWSIREDKADKFEEFMQKLSQH